MEKSVIDLDARQSTLIKAMRFPLICLVVLAHSAGTFPTPTVEWSFDGWNVFHFVTEMVSRHICSIGTCWFFVFSGYFFLRYLKENEFCAEWVFSKWKKRIRSLLIPYLIWNLIAVLAFLAKNELFGVLNLGKEYGNLKDLPFDPLSWFFLAPKDYPLWFIRDLMLLSLLAPLIYLIFKKMPYLSLSMLILAYLSPLDPSIPMMRSIFFFSIGAWFGTAKMNMLELCRKVKVPALFGAVIMLLLATSQIGRPLHTFLLRVFYPLGMIVFMNFCDSVIKNEKLCEVLCNLSSSVFFIFAAHEIYILGWTKGLCHRLFGESLAGAWISYWLVPIIVLVVCLALYWLLNRIMPSVLAFACGGRTQNNKK